MKHYLHHLPGRLRVKTPAIKSNPETAQELRDLLTPLIGISSLVINPVTGSILVEYAPESIDSASILNLLKESGYVDFSKTVTHDQYIQAKVSKTAKIFWSAVSGAFIETALAGTGLSFLAFLL
jgi:hypothetical protein